MLYPVCGPRRVDRRLIRINECLTTAYSVRRLFRLGFGRLLLLRAKTDNHTNDRSGDQAEQGGREVSNTLHVEQRKQRAGKHRGKGADTGCLLPETAKQERNHAAGDPERIAAGKDGDDMSKIINAILSITKYLFLIIP